MPVIHKTTVQNDKELFIKFPYGINIRKEQIVLSIIDYFSIEQVSHKVADNETEIVNVFLLGYNEFLDYFSTVI
jgi:hypothetical protein